MLIVELVRIRRVDMWRHRGGMSCTCPGRLTGGLVVDALVNQVDEVIVHLGHQSKVHMSELCRVVGIVPAHGRCQM